LTPPGQELYDFIRPFFENLGTMADRLRGGMAQHIRIAASEIVIRDHLPSVLQAVQKQFPKLKVTLKEGYHPQVLDWFERQEIDLSIGLLGGKQRDAVRSLPMFKLPLVLLVPRTSTLRDAADLWKRDRINETLITVPSNEPLCRALQEGLSAHQVDWFSGIEVSTVDLVQIYVARGYGYGVTVGVPKSTWHPEVRALPLHDFPLTTFGVTWQGRRTAVLDAMITIVSDVVRKLMKGEDPGLMLLK
jgi:DNA-binding transcriptional LysR family regulator